MLNVYIYTTRTIGPKEYFHGTEKTKEQQSKIASEEQNLLYNLIEFQQPDTLLRILDNESRKLAPILDNESWKLAPCISAWSAAK